MWFRTYMHMYMHMCMYMYMLLYMCMHMYSSRKRCCSYMHMYNILLQQHNTTTNTTDTPIVHAPGWP